MVESDPDGKLILEVVDLSDLERLWKKRWVAVTLKSLSPSVVTVAQAVLGRLVASKPVSFGMDNALAAGLFQSLGVLRADSISPALDETEAAPLHDGGCFPAFPELHVLSSPDLGHAVFHPPTFTLFRVNEWAASVLEDCARSVPIGAVAERHGVSVSEVESLVARISRVVDTRPSVRVARDVPGMLQKLVLNISNDCNMRCRYCYADGGSYGGNRALMTLQIARQAVERVFEHYKNVHTVMFFGGEPTLNPDAIEVCCKRVLELYHQRAVLQMPRLGMVTNGLILNQRMLDIIRRHELLVTVSLDGPAEINDLLRVSCDEKGSFRRIARNIRRIQEATSGREPSRVEATYTSAHHAAGFSVMDMADYFDREFGIKDCHVVPVTVEPGHRLGCRHRLENVDVFREAAVQLIESWSTENPKQLLSISRCLLTVATRLSVPYLCGAGLTELTVSVSGDIYPCYMLFRDEFKMGSVLDSEVFQSRRFDEVQRRFRDSAKSCLAKCSQCWARGFCRVCYKVPYIENQTIDRIPSYACKMNQAIAESGLLALGRVRAQPDLWALLCRNVDAMVGEGYHK